MSAGKNTNAFIYDTIIVWPLESEHVGVVGGVPQGGPATPVMRPSRVLASFPEG